MGHKGTALAALLSLFHWWAVRLGPSDSQMLSCPLYMWKLSAEILTNTIKFIDLEIYKMLRKWLLYIFLHDLML